ncbi:ATP-binding protein [Micromonospora sp. DT231]|uniref:ATP-binding protein n=1 Tax=Micromonospora sp. DT231 TaxID=3416526 RepID=UPI003CEF3FB6
MIEPALPFGEHLRTLRRAAGLTLEQLAETSGVSARAISDMERGHSRTPQARTLAALADGLGLDDEGRAGLVAVVKAARSPSAAGRPRLCELPRGVGDFVGREAELAIARATAGQAATGDGPPPVLVVHGPPGLGKTAFAVRVAEELRGSFPGGSMFLDLRGTDAVPLPVGEALHRLLRALHISPSQIAHSDDERSAQLRAVLRDRPCLLVLDNVGSETQARMLFPSGGRCLVVVTSRRTLGGLEGVVRVGLPPLAVAESASLLAAIATQAADPAAVAQVELVSGLCGHMPLALRIAGTRLAARPRWTVDNLVDRLVDADRRLAALTAGDTGVAAAFALSHAQLSAPAAALFRRLAHVPGVDFAAPLAAVLTETGVFKAEERLEELVELGLLQAEGVDRYRFHDLIRLYAGERLSAEEPLATRTETARRMTDWLLETTIVAGRWYEPAYGALPDDWDGLVPLATLEEAGAWLWAETDNWLAAYRVAAADGRHELVVRVAEAIHWYSDSTLLWRGWYEVYGLARTAAAALPDRRRHIALMNGFAWAAIYGASRAEEGAEVAMEAYRMAEAIGDLEGQGWALQFAAAAWRRIGRLDESMWALRQSRDLADRAGDHDGYIQIFQGIGFALIIMGRHDEAIDEFQQALVEMDRRPVSARADLGARAGALSGLAEAHNLNGHWAQGLEAAERALPVVLERGESSMLGDLYFELGRARAELGFVAEARADLTRALHLLDGTGRRDPQQAMAREILARLGT